MSKQGRRPPGREPATATARLVRRTPAKVVPQQFGPGIIVRRVEDREDGPDCLRWLPGVVVGIDPGDRAQGIGHQPAYGGELHPRAHPQPVRHLLREPTLHPARRHGDDLAGERVGQRIGQQVGQSGDQPIRSFRAMQLKTHDGPKPRDPH